MVQDRVSIHESTVQKVASGALGPGAGFYQSPVKTSSERRRLVLKQTNMQVHPLVMWTAKRIIHEGSYTRIQIVDETTVIVR